MKYLGCQKKGGICDRCQTTFEYMHLMENQRRPRRFCLSCASHWIGPTIPEATEARCRREGGKRVSGEQGEKDYDQSQGENFA
jgi:hypothetical protein